MGLALSVTGLLAQFACSGAQLQAEPGPGSAPSASTRWIAPEPAVATGWLEAPGRVISSPNDTAQIAAPLSARVTHVRVHPGERVAQGDALVDVVMPELLKAAGALRAAELRLDSWHTRRAIIAPLVAKQLALVAELSDIDANIASVRGELESARAVLRAAGEPDKRVHSLLDGPGTVSLRAPFTGVVVAVTAKVGEVRDPAAGPLLELVSEDADTRIEARFLATPPEGVRFIWTDGVRTLPLTLERLSPHADDRDGSRAGWLRVEQAGARLVAGSLGRVKIVAAEGWMAVPASALRERDGATTVEQLTSAGSRAVSVQVVQRSGNEAIVTGLARGAKIASDASAASGRLQ